MGASVQFEAEDLSPGNYYFVYDVNKENRDGAKPFQIRTGKTTTVDINF